MSFTSILSLESSKVTLKSFLANSLLWCFPWLSSELNIFHSLVLNSACQPWFLYVFHITYLFHGKAHRLCLKVSVYSEFIYVTACTFVKPSVLDCCPLEFPFFVSLLHIFYPWYNTLFPFFLSPFCFGRVAFLFSLLVFQDRVS